MKVPDLTAMLADAHNRIRKRHGAEPLSKDETLKNEAQVIADKCDLNPKKIQETDTPGENRFFLLGPDEGPEEFEGLQALESLVGHVMHDWYDTAMSYYDPNQSEHKDGKTWTWTYSDPFTQVVWKSTQRLGCAQAKCTLRTVSKRQKKTKKPLQGTVVVCKYDPPGNIPGQFLENVESG